MNEDVLGVVVGHGRLAEGLVDAVAEITGSRDGLLPVDNEGLTPETLEARIAELTARRPSVIFVDMAVGSCAYAARRLKLRQPDTAIVCGVNLPLLLDFSFHRTLPIEEIIARLRTHVGVSIEHSKDMDGDSSLQDR